MATKGSEQGEQLWTAVFEDAKTDGSAHATERTSRAVEINYEELTKAAGDKS